MKKFTIIAIVVAVLVGAIALRMAFPAVKAPAEDQAANVTVAVLNPENKTIANSMEFIANVEAAESVNIMPKMAGKVAKTYVKPGDVVKKGDPLFTLDDSDIALQLGIAAISLDMAKAQYEYTLGAAIPLQNDQAWASREGARLQYEAAQKAYDGASTNSGATRNILQAQIDAANADFAAGGGSAELQAATADLKQAKTDLAADPTNTTLQAALQAAQARYDIIAELSDLVGKAQNALTSFESGVSQASAGYDAADLQFDMARAAYAQTTGESRAYQEKMAKLQYDQAQASYSSVASQYNNIYVTSPIDGIVESTNIKVHEFTNNAAPSVVVAGHGSLTVTFGVPTKYHGVISLGNQVQVTSGGKSTTATVTQVSPAADPKTGLFYIKAEFANADGQFINGTSAKVFIDTERSENALTVPVRCVRFEDNKPYVFTIKDGVAIKTFIEIGITNEESYEVKTGLSAGDKVVSTWHPSLRDGAQVATIEQ